MTSELGYVPFDCDNHYYEAIDAFTRHLSPKDGPRCVQWAEIDGRKYQVVGGRVSRVVTNPTFDPIAPAGAMHDYFRGNPDKKHPLEFLSVRESIRPEYRDRDARLATMDRQGVSKIWLFPTLGMLYEELLKHDPEGVGIMFTAFNRWLLEDWGFDHADRIFAGPYISLASVEWACSELEWAVANGARVIVMRPAAPTTANGQRSPFDTMYDPFWARVNEAGITTVIHAGDSGYSSNGYANDSFSAQFSGGGWKPSIKSFAIERAAQDFIITSVFEKLFDRFPNLRMASVENGSEFLGDACNKLTSTAKKMPGYFTEDPVETLRRFWSINPFWEDDVHEVARIMGADRVLFGSDWPHIEGMPNPLDYLPELKAFDDVDRRRILLDNVTELNTPRPV
ncbi:MAG: amidohydrolase [Acidimicrobiia bacterium]|nr:amidohydrolase [Actinomycetota bacterium]NDD96845.1 amidohydrolase [Actinomycetota bacterium]NDE80731.1 amidohydrolase [Actinomycetota bacterium]NDF31793.1 amidohydrolase [Acidimicrobiia bacterium]NDH46897.1 amidohydrolase [Acidimicrobiia bacterium]